MGKSPAWWFILSSFTTLFLLVVWVVYSVFAIGFGPQLTFEQPLMLLSVFSMFGMFASGMTWLGKWIDKRSKWDNDSSNTPK